MDIKPKPCKGINKAKSYKGCGDLTKYRTMGLCNNCLGDFLFGNDVGKLLMEKKVLPKAKIKAKKEKTKISRLERSKLIEGTKTPSYYKKELQRQINAIVRVIDDGFGCIATNNTTGKQNGGHYISVGSNATIRYHLFNIWIQSEHSNKWKSGDTVRYQDGIVRIFGHEMLDYMNSLKSHPPIKLSIDDLKELISKARAKLKWLKLQDRRFTKEERISLRKEINEYLGIYEF